MKAKTFDRAFDDDKDITTELDLSTARRINQAPRRVNVDFPAWMLDALDKEEACLGATRQSIIKI